MTLKKSSDFSIIFKKGEKLARSTSVFFFLAREDNSFRYGVSVSRKVGNAVFRNYIKRVIRSVVSFFPILGYDLVVLCRRDKIFNIFTFTRDYLNLWRKLT